MSAIKLPDSDIRDLVGVAHSEINGHPGRFIAVQSDPMSGASAGLAKVHRQGLVAMNIGKRRVFR